MGGCKSKNLACDPQKTDPSDPRQKDSPLLQVQLKDPGNTNDPAAGRISGDPKVTADIPERPGSGTSNGSKKSVQEKITPSDDNPEAIEQKQLSARSQANGAVWSKLRNAVKTIHGCNLSSFCSKSQNS